jgi:hypothetical protein
VEARHRAASYLVECFWPGIAPETLARTERDIDAVISTMRRQGRDINFVGSILVLVDESVFCLFDGDEADVRLVSEKAGIPVERVLETIRSERTTI